MSVGLLFLGMEDPAVAVAFRPPAKAGCYSLVSATTSSPFVVMVIQAYVDLGVVKT